MLVLGIESSCDETSVAIVKDGCTVLANEIASQIEIHKLYGGVVPEIASRNHVKIIDKVLQQTLEKANCSLTDIDAVAVTYGAGLIGALMVGVNFAKGLAYALNKPLIAVNHIHGHICANYLTDKTLEPPFMCLITSGGHTAIAKVKNFTKFEIVGSTLDDALGEAYDKVARVLNLEYPGGPKVDKLATIGEAKYIFTHSKTLEKSFNVSYSGLKTAVVNFVHNAKQKNEPIEVENICASFQHQAINEVVDKTIKACKKFKMTKLALAGGVSANSYLRKYAKEQCDLNNIELYFPKMEFCTDNAAMIASAGYYYFKNNLGFAQLDLTAKANLDIQN